MDKGNQRGTKYDNRRITQSYKKMLREYQYSSKATIACVRDCILEFSDYLEYLWHCFSLELGKEFAMKIQGTTRFRLRRAITINPHDIGLHNCESKSFGQLEIVGTFHALVQAKGYLSIQALRIRLFAKQAIRQIGGELRIDYLYLYDTKSVSKTTPIIELLQGDGFELLQAQTFVRGKHKTLIAINTLKESRNIRLFELGLTLNKSSELEYLVTASQISDSTFGSKEHPLTRRQTRNAIIKIDNEQGIKGEAPIIYVANPEPILELAGEVKVIKC